MNQRVKFLDERNGSGRGEFDLSLLRREDGAAILRIKRAETVIKRRRPGGGIQDNLDGLGFEGGQALPTVVTVSS